MFNCPEFDFSLTATCEILRKKVCSVHDTFTLAFTDTDKKLILPPLRMSLSSKPQHRTHINPYSSKYLTCIHDSYKDVPLRAWKVYGAVKSILS
jgi:hypothetical protein